MPNLHLRAVAFVSVIALAVFRPPPDANMLAKESCPSGCPFSCRKGRGASRVSGEQFSQFVRTVKQFPTSSLWWYRDLIAHWRIVREECWLPQLESKMMPNQWSASDRRKWDCIVVTQALSFRSLPPSAYRSAWEKGILEGHYVNDESLCGVLNAMLATEDLQVEVGQSLPARAVSTRSIKEFTSLEGVASPYFYSVLAKASQLAIAARERASGLVGSEAVSTALGNLRKAQLMLDEAIDVMAPLFEAKEGPDGAPSLLISKRNLKGIGVINLDGDIPGLSVYSVYLNAWIDMECNRVLLGEESGYSKLILKHLDELIDHLEGLNEHFYTQEDVGNTRLSLYSPEPLIISLAITALELSYLTHVEGDASVLERLQGINTMLEQNREGWPDWYDAAIIRRYLRSESPYLDGAWSKGQFDRWVERD